MEPTQPAPPPPGPVPPGPVPPGPVPPSSVPLSSAQPWSAQPWSAPLGPARAPRPPRFVVWSKADLRLVIAALAIGVCFDIAVRGSIATIAVTAGVAALTSALLLSKRLRGRASTLTITMVALFGLVFTLRTSPWVIAPVAFAVIFLLLIGTSLGADGAGLTGTFPALAARLGVVFCQLALAPGMFHFQGQSEQGALARKWGAAVLRGAAIAVPVLLVTGLLLASADPIFRSWFNPGLVSQHIVYLIIGAWLMVGLARAASAERPLPRIAEAPKLGAVEIVIVLGSLCALYAVFVVAQFVALSGAGHHILVTQGLTYAEYARSGFFRLLVCAAITLLVLLGVRGCANSAHLVIGILSALTAVLTVGVVVVAYRRLELYEAAFGLTMLRLACFAVAAWIGVVFLLFGATLVPRGLPGRRFPAAFIASGLVLIAVWAAVNPAAIVASTNLRRAEQGRTLDVGQVVSLGPDATPEVISALPRLPRRESAALRSAACGQASDPYAGTSFNLDRFTASTALARHCHPGHRASAGDR